MSDFDRHERRPVGLVDRATAAALGALGFCLAVGVLVSAMRLAAFGL